MILNNTGKLTERR